ncbi:hypothetical protein [Cognatiluteimonas profundi]|uniref:hypothetical protein n=1 Tax=Cognatiluteimonas profundi TaxID=2594501 RepID=UPI00131D9A8D|nr:hypothetical protein [Lysobacter profundi]
MALTLGFTGMDAATEAALTAAFNQANGSLGHPWQLVPDAEAATVIVDMDSMYGPMSWLRLHAAGKQVVGLSSAARTQTDFHLRRPFDADSVAELLQAVSGGQPAKAAGKPAAEPQASRKSAAAAPKESRASAPAAAPPHVAAVPSGMSPSPVPQDLLPEEHPLPVDEEAEPPAPAPHLPASVEAGTLAPTTITPSAAVVHPAPAVEPIAPATPAREPVFADWLAPGALSGRFRYRRAVQEPLLIDANARQYFATTSLKPLASVIEGRVGREDFQPVDAAAWARETEALGAAQPLNRLQWFGGLVAGKGHLLPEFDTSGRYRLGKWPQTEREFPKHFRIATAMMKGPATLAELAGASGVSFQEVADFVNASLITGYAELVPDAPPEPVEPPKPAGLFGRRRGK